MTYIIEISTQYEKFRISAIFNNFDIGIPRFVIANRIPIICKSFVGTAHTLSLK